MTTSGPITTSLSSPAHVAITAIAPTQLAVQHPNMLSPIDSVWASPPGWVPLASSASGNFASLVSVLRQRASTQAAAYSDAEPVWFAGTSSINLVIGGEGLSRRLFEIERQLSEAAEGHRAAVTLGLGVTSGLTIGYVVWLVRGGVLVSSMLSALPAWQMIDPLPVATSRKGNDRDFMPENSTAERLFDRYSLAQGGSLSRRIQSVWSRLFRA